MALTQAAPAGLCDDKYLQPELHRPCGPAAAWAHQAGARVLAWRGHTLARPKSEIALLVGPPSQTRLLAVTLATATRAEMLTVLPGDTAALLRVAERVHARGGRVKRGTAPLLVYIDAVEFCAAPGSAGRAILSGLLEAAAAGATTIIVGATDSLGAVNTDMLALWAVVRHVRSRPGVMASLHPDIATAH